MSKQQIIAFVSELADNDSRLATLEDFIVNHLGDDSFEADPCLRLVRKFGSQGQDERHPRSDWQTEVGNGDTSLGYWEWLLQQYEIEEENSDD
jgi:hypothetical protein